jgi:DNA invertase Pin-like site-specific DNA recombinase
VQRVRPGGPAPSRCRLPRRRRTAALREYVEVESGKRNNRPKLAAALAHAKVTGATLVIAKLDRLSRNVAFLANLMDSGVEFVATDMPQANRFTIHILAAVAEHEAKMISDRTKSAMAAAKARGARFGCPNGARALRGHGGNAMARPAVTKRADEHANAVRPIIDALRDEGISGLRGIAAALNEPSIRSANGKRWYPTTVANLLRRVPERTPPTRVG